MHVLVLAHVVRTHQCHAPTVQPSPYEGLAGNLRNLYLFA